MRFRFPKRRVAFVQAKGWIAVRLKERFWLEIALGIGLTKLWLIGLVLFGNRTFYCCWCVLIIRWPAFCRSIEVQIFSENQSAVFENVTYLCIKPTALQENSHTTKGQHVCDSHFHLLHCHTTPNPSFTHLDMRKIVLYLILLRFTDPIRSILTFESLG